MFGDLNIFQSPNSSAILLGLMAIWSLVWKGFALWRAAKRDQKYWYIVMLVVNTVGILEILYLAFFSRKDKKK